MKRQLTWLNGNSTRIWRFLVLALLTGLVGICGWVFVQVRDLPKDYIAKPALAVMQNRIDSKADKTAISTIHSRLVCIENQITDLDNFLRDYFAERADKK